MRFAYIDSQGNEVPIPSVDALALRIELGAIGPDTQLYDAQADRWGPASSHEIFHTLSRDTAEEGFVAPPPPLVAPEPPEGAEAPEAPEGSEEAGTPESAEEPATEATPPDAEAAEGGEPDTERPVFDLSDEFLGTTEGEPATPQAADAGTDDSSTAESGPVVGPGDDLGLDLTLTDVGGDATASQGTEGAPPPEPAAGEAEGDEADEATFDFGGFGALELEPTSLDAETSGAETPEAGTASSEDEPMTLDGGGTDETMDFSAPPDLGGGLELEQPMSEFTPEAPPAWMDQGGQEESTEEGSMEFGSGQAAPPEEEERKATRGQRPPPPERPQRQRPTPRNRPSPPRRVKKRSMAGPLVGIVVVAALAGGGWYGWQWYQGHRAAEEAAQAAAEAPPPVAIPEIPAELLPEMRQLGNAALGATITHLTSLQRTFSLPAEPPSDWLAGIYMANASKYGNVRTYWQGIRDFVDSVRAVDAKVFHAEYVKQLDKAGITGDTASLLLERADSGFAATRQDRWAAYALMDDLVNASLNLHQFLLDNQSQIDYDPAAGGMSQDPVLEAVPKTKALGTEMWGKVDQITTALDSLGTLDRVTTARLVAVLFDRIQRAGFQ